MLSHDSVAQADFGPVLAPLPEDLPEDEEAMRIVCLVKNNQPLVRHFLFVISNGLILYISTDTDMKLTRKFDF